MTALATDKDIHAPKTHNEKSILLVLLDLHMKYLFK